jgi:hypothetical protein
VTNANLPSNIPNPDPSVVANERLEEAKVSLRREMAAMKEETRRWTDSLQLLLESKIDGRDTNFEERFASVKIQFAERDTRTTQSAQQVKLAVDAALQAQKEAAEGRDANYNEKFQSIQTQFKERDVRTDQTASQVKLAVDAALQAQKEAAGEQAKSFSAATTKSETAMNKQIEGLDGKITDVKDRLNRVEAMSIGVNFNRSESRDQTSISQHHSQNQIAVFMGAVGVAGFLVALGGIIYTATRPAPLAPAVVYAQPGGVLQADPLKPQHQSFPLAPTWENLYRIVQ